MTTLAFLFDFSQSERLVFWSGVLVWFPITIWVIKATGMMIMAELDLLWGIPSLLAAVGIGALTIKPPSPEIAPVLCASTFVFLALLPFVQQVVHRRQLRLLDCDRLDNAYDLLARDPDNPVALSRISQILYDWKFKLHAIAVLESALNPNHPSILVEEQQILARWKREQYHSSDALLLKCKSCGHQNPVQAVFCTSCNAPFLKKHLRSFFCGGSAAETVMAMWFLMSLLLVGNLILAKFVNRGASASVSVMSTVIGIFLMVKALRPGKAVSG